MTYGDTIAAISTPVGEGAIAVIRLSGPKALAILSSIFRGSVLPNAFRPREAYFGWIYDGSIKIDEVLATFFRGPASFTAEDVIEISCHGGILVTRRLLYLVLSAGARMADPGEFTQRAFLNGRLDLTQAEAVMDVIRSQTELALRAANEQLAGNLGREVSEIRELLLTLLAHLEAYIDFPDEGIDPETGSLFRQRLSMIRYRLEKLLATADQGRILRHGLRTVIYGAPNVGKSSLLNLLLGYERAIVTDIPGTTRDTIEEVVSIRGIPVRLIDTAGARDSVDLVEQEGVRRARKELESADFIIHMVDGSVPRFREQLTIDRKGVLLLNKADLGIHPDWQTSNGIPFSCKERTGLDDLNQAIWQSVTGGDSQIADFRIAINARHQAALTAALTLLDAARASLDEEKSPEFIAIELRGALDSIGEVVGKVDTEDLLGRIFSEFCIGK